MKTAYQELLESNVWDPRFGLPAVPMHLNPHIYTAYAVRILERDLAPTLAGDLRRRYQIFLNQTLSVKDGLLHTYPDTEVASYDDVMGAAFMNAQFARRTVENLAEHFGFYGSRGFLYRFIFLLPFLKAAGDLSVSITNQIAFITSLFFSLWFPAKATSSDLLLLWLAIPEMMGRKLPLTKRAIMYYNTAQIKRGTTPQSIFSTYYLVECPWFGTWARKDWL